jgi:PucR family transcriptional regulator, purine catabolism regulatory protein
MSDDGSDTHNHFPPERRRAKIVRRLLAEEPVEFAELAELDYEVHALWHLGVIVTGTGAQDALRRVRTNLGCDILPASGDNGTVLAWLGASQKFKVLDVERLFSANHAMWELLAIGGLGRGLAGWRQTHREAKEALLRALHRPEQIMRYADGPLLAAALENDTLGTWLREFLTPLRSRPDGGVALRQTLRAYIDAEFNYSAAASALNVRRHTVGSRVRMAEKLLNRPLRTCLAELDAALRLVDLVPDDSSPSW